jgi:hypothetical protein
MLSAIVWINVANAIYLVSYTVRDILWLRILTVVAATLLIPYYAMQPVPLQAAIAWNLVFIAINLYWIVRLIIERRPVQFTPDEARLRVLSFPSLTPREARKLFTMGVWDDLGPDASVTKRDLDTKRFSVILRGDADVIYRETKISQLGDGQFVGVIDAKANVIDIDVISRTAMRVMCWPRDELQAFMTKRPDVALALERSVGFELQHLLDTTLTELPSTPKEEGGT